MTKVHFPADAKLRATLTSRGAPLSRDFTSGVDVDIPDPEWQVIKETWGHKSPAVTPEVFVPPISYRTPTYNMAQRVAWWGAGTTRTATSVADFATQYAASADGDTIQWANGTYAVAAPIVIAKKIRIKAQNPRQAIFTGGTAPTSATNDPGHTVYCFRTNSAAADGAYFEDMYFKYFGVSIDLDSSKNVVIQGNKIETNYDIGIILWDCVSPLVHMNEFWDPYLAGDTAATLTAPPSFTDAMMDYAVNVYGCTNPKVTHNYFHGSFNQVVSFKEGNLNPTASYNTFEGFNLTGLFFGQNKPGGNGPYGDTGLPIAPDHGILTAEYNVFRPIVNGSNQIYRGNIAIRMWHVNGDMVVRGNVVESSIGGIFIEGKESPINTNGYATGTALIERNTVSGSWRDVDDGVVVHDNGTVHAASTANTALSGLGAGSISMDGFTFSGGSTRALLKNQTNPAENGIYTLNGVGVNAFWSRTSSADTWDELSGSQVTVLNGTVNGGKVFYNAYTAGGTLGTTAVTFVLGPPRVGALTDVGNGGLRLYKGIYAGVTLRENRIVLHDVPSNYCFDDGAYVGATCPIYNEVSTQIITAQYADHRLRVQSATYDPDLSFDKRYTRSNEITNPSFEAGTTDWVTSGINALAAGATLTRVATGAATGLYFGNIAVNGTTNSGAAIPVKLKGGYTYRIRIKFKRISGTATAKIALQRSTTPFAETVLAATASDAAFTEYTTLFTAPADDTYHLYCRQNAGTASVFAVDGVFASPYDVAYFDGDTLRNRIINHAGIGTGGNLTEWIQGWTSFSASSSNEALQTGSLSAGYTGFGSNIQSGHTGGTDWWVLYGTDVGLSPAVTAVEASEVYGLRATVLLLTTIPTPATLKLMGHFQNSANNSGVEVLAQSVTMATVGTGNNQVGQVIDLAGNVTVPAGKVFGTIAVIFQPVGAISTLASVVVGKIQMVKLTATGDTNPPYMEFDRTGWDSTAGLSTSWYAPRL